MRPWIAHTSRTQPVGDDVLICARIAVLARSDAEKRGFLPASKWVWKHPTGHPGRVEEYQIGGAA